MYYDYPKRQRYSDEGMDNVFDFEQGKSFVITNGQNCCWTPNADSEGNPAKMPYLGPNEMYTDEGPMDGGESWILSNETSKSHTYM